MKCDEAMQRLRDLRLLQSIYRKMNDDPRQCIYKPAELKKLLKTTRNEIERLVDLMYNMELDDSYDQNTGLVNKLYL